MKVTISGSYRKFPEELDRSLEAFRDCGVEVLSPKSAHIISSLDDHFVILQGDDIIGADPVSEMRTVENNHLRAIQSSDLLWLMLPGYCGPATAFEVGWALAHDIPVFYSGQQVQEPIIKCYARPVQSIEHLVNTFDSAQCYVDPAVSRLFARKLFSHHYLNATIAVGGVVEDDKGNVLLVKTGTWGDQFTLVGGRITEGAGLINSLAWEVKHQLGLDGYVMKNICAFQELPNAGFYLPETNRIFIDYAVRVENADVSLGGRVQDYVCMPPRVALRDVPIEPNARKTLEMKYAA